MRYLCLIYDDEQQWEASSKKEQLGGFYLIDARDLKDAIQVASRAAVSGTTAARVALTR